MSTNERFTVEESAALLHAIFPRYPDLDGMNQRRRSVRSCLPCDHVTVSEVSPALSLTTGHVASIRRPVTDRGIPVYSVRVDIAHCGRLQTGTNQSIDSLFDNVRAQPLPARVLVSPSFRDIWPVPSTSMMNC